MLLVEVLLELGELVQVPLLLPQPLPGVTELPSAAASATVASKARRTAAIAADKSPVKSQSGFQSQRRV